VSPQGELTPFGVRPNIRPFRVAGTFETGFYDIDDNWCFVSIEAAQRALSLQDVINQIELKVDDLDRAPKSPATWRRPPARATPPPPGWSATASC